MKCFICTTYDKILFNFLQAARKPLGIDNLAHTNLCMTNELFMFIIPNFLQVDLP